MGVGVGVKVAVGVLVGVAVGVWVAVGVFVHEEAVSVKAMEVCVDLCSAVGPQPTTIKPTKKKIEINLFIFPPTMINVLKFMVN